MFGGFKASMNFFGKKNKQDVRSEITPDMCVSGAYRTSRDDSFGYRNSFEHSKKSISSEQVLQPMRPTKSANDLTKSKNVNHASIPLRPSAVEISRDPRGAEQVDLRNGVQNRKDAKSQEKENKKKERQRLVEQRVREKQAAQERVRQDKLKKERERKEAQPNKVKRDKKPEKIKITPQPQAAASAAPTSSQYSTNTIDSSISKSSGPPPYSDVPILGQEQNSKVSSQRDNRGNVALSKPVDTGSWDMISQHRQQVIRPTAIIGSGSKTNKQTVIDLNYNFGSTSQPKDNSDA